MDVVAVQQANLNTARQLRKLQRRDLPGLRGVPSLAPAPPTCTLGAANAASAITSSVGVSIPSPGRFTFWGVQTPAQDGSNSRWLSGNYSGSTTQTPWGFEFDFDSAVGKLEIVLFGSGGRTSVIVDGQAVSAGPTFTVPSDSATYNALVDFGGACTKRIRVELTSNQTVVGVNVSPTDTVSAVGNGSRQRWMVIGDSFTEPTIQDTAAPGAWAGWVHQLGYLLGVDAWAAGAGGIGYLQTLASPARTKFRDKLAADIYPYTPDVIVWAGGINDRTNWTAAQVQTEALLCFQAVQANLPRCQQIVLSPFWPRGFATYATNLLAVADAIRAAAASANLPYLDVLRLPLTSNPFAATTLTAGVSSGVTSISAAVSIPVGAYFQIGTGTNAEVRKCSSVSGSGPYAVVFSGTGGGALGSSHSSGEAVLPVGPGIYTGSGNLSNLTADGNSDRYTGTDQTHPTIAGHANIARQVYRLIAEYLAA